MILRTASTATAAIKTRLHSGYTTWYNYYGNVTEKIVKRDLQALLRLPERLDIFQIDDGYQNAIGDWLILGCGVPLAPAFGKVDFCRIGADMGLNWMRNRFTTREDVSTPNAIYNTVFRRHLDSRAFMNDHDVFLLRDNNMFMSYKKRKKNLFRLK